MKRVFKEGGVEVYKNRKTGPWSKNYPKPKDHERFLSKPKSEYKTIITEDLYRSIFKTLV